MGYGVKIFLPSPPNYVTRSRGLLKTIISWESISSEIGKTVKEAPHSAADLLLVKYSIEETE